MNMARDRTVALIRQLRATPVQHVRRVPRPLSLDPIVREYLNALRPICDTARRALAEVEAELLADLREQRRLSGRTDAISHRPLAPGRAIALLSRAVSWSSTWVNPTAVEIVVRKFGRRTVTHQQQQLARQVSAALSVPYQAIERPVRDLVPQWTAENVELIQSVPSRFFERIAADVEHAYATGMHPDALARRFARRHQQSIADARRIARTEIGKLNSRVTRERHQALGIERYVWQCVGDSQERDCHAELDGKVCSWDEPPEGGGTDDDEDGHPGEGINCRCVALPVLEGFGRTDAIRVDYPGQPRGQPTNAGQFSSGGAGKQVTKSRRTSPVRSGEKPGETGKAGTTADPKTTESAKPVEAPGGTGAPPSGPPGPPSPIASGASDPGDPFRNATGLRTLPPDPRRRFRDPMGTRRTMEISRLSPRALLAEMRTAQAANWDARNLARHQTNHPEVGRTAEEYRARTEEVLAHPERVFTGYHGDAVRGTAPAVTWTFARGRLIVSTKRGTDGNWHITTGHIVENGLRHWLNEGTGSASVELLPTTR